jgi:hypothetical protein
MCVRQPRRLQHPPPSGDVGGHRPPLQDLAPNAQSILTRTGDFLLARVGKTHPSAARRSLALPIRPGEKFIGRAKLRGAATKPNIFPYLQRCRRVQASSLRCAPQNVAPAVTGGRPEILPLKSNGSSNAEPSGKKHQTSAAAVLDLAFLIRRRSILAVGRNRFDHGGEPPLASVRGQRRKRHRDVTAGQLRLHLHL